MRQILLFPILLLVYIIGGLAWFIAVMINAVRELVKIAYEKVRSIC
jgi:uncharacterized protein YxeA